MKRFKKRNKTTGTNADRYIGQVGFMLKNLMDIQIILIKKILAMSLILLGE